MLKMQQNPDARIAIEPDFEWDGQDAYLFDIDGTLLRSRDRIHVDSVAWRVNRVTGFEITLAGIQLQGNTDTAILREACRQAGIPSEVLEEQYETILETMRNCVAERRQELEPVVMPGVNEVLRHLAQRGALLGVASGNLETIGWIKIERAGLREWFNFGGFSDRLPVRAELVKQAVIKARAMDGRRGRAESKVCVVGDTPRDIEAARANSLSVIAVATGRSSFEELLQCRPDACVSSLADLLATVESAP
jgi:phosphoglycolate phosphatase-like HAD superfamily hydrolase